MAFRRKPKTKAQHLGRKAKGPTANNSKLPLGYMEVLKDIKERVRTARVRASLSVNRELIILYWEIGRMILNRQEAEGWGTKVIDRLSVDLKQEFPDQEGFSTRNLKYMRNFAESYPDEEIVQQAAAQIPWFHNCTILDKVQDAEQRHWYIGATIEHSWSRAVLIHQIESDLYKRKGKALTNFQSNPARSAIRPGSAAYQGPIQLRVPRAWPGHF